MTGVQPGLLRVVLDTNILVRGLLNEISDSGRILQAAEQRRFIPLVSKPLIAEYRDVLTNRDLAETFPELDMRRVRTALGRLKFVGDMVRHINFHIEFPRDPKDAKLLELSVVGGASHLITSDADLLDLPTSRHEPGRQLRRALPHFAIVKPNAFVAGFPGLFQRL